MKKIIITKRKWNKMWDKVKEAQHILLSLEKDLRKFPYNKLGKKENGDTILSQTVEANFQLDHIHYAFYRSFEIKE